eukprot:SAG22_NODE_1203_length_5178_cov_1.734200_2_plen_189_part_00
MLPAASAAARSFCTFESDLAPGPGPTHCFRYPPVSVCVQRGAGQVVSWGWAGAGVRSPWSGKAHLQKHHRVGPDEPLVVKRRQRPVLGRPPPPGSHEAGALDRLRLPALPPPGTLQQVEGGVSTTADCGCCGCGCGRQGEILSGTAAARAEFCSSHLGRCEGGLPEEREALALGQAARVPARRRRHAG